MSEETKRVIAVLGMHRSGTSAITRGLQVMGVSLGENLMPPSAGNNEKGFFEDIDINRLNIDALQAVGSEWYKLTPIEASEIQLLRSQGYILRAVELLRAKTEFNQVFAFKDPRVAKLLPFWNEVVNYLQFDIGYVIALRHPLSIVKSLEKRDKLAPVHSYLLWLGHILESLRCSVGKPRVLVNYDQLMHSPDRELSKIADALNLKIDETELSAYKSNFLDTTLRHTIYDPTDLELDADCPPLVYEVFVTLSEIASGERDLDDIPFAKDVDQWSIEFDRVKSSLSLADQQFTEIINLRHVIAEYDSNIQNLRTTIHEANERILGLQNAVNEGSSNSLSLQHAVQERDAMVLSLQQVVNDREEKILELQRTTQEKDIQISVLQKAVYDHNKKVLGLQSNVQERDIQISTLQQAVDERDQKIQLLTTQNENSRLNIEKLIEVNEAQQENLRTLETRAKDLTNEIVSIQHSKSWKLTKPVRHLRRLHMNLIQDIRSKLSRNLRLVWQGLPVSIARKQKFKDALFSRLPLIFNRSQAYSNWLKGRNATHILKGPLTSDTRSSTLVSSDMHVPIMRTGTSPRKPARVICFYLPQFHTFPENDAWWGEGFTEWTNVRPAKPQFEGHYQPHIPGELGYYNLLDPKVQQRQVELAKLYGIEAFCFYFYWFGGHRLMELPIRNYLNNPALDLPFCLCWANENWSRRWDGLDSEILISQKHSPEDDIAFIAHISEYMRDPRYIRINDRPLLLVYRPNLLPYPMETAERWRNWCRNNGIGEIYLAYTQSFESVDPSTYGFDAAIEFPPNNMHLPNITHVVTPVVKNFSSNLYDWQELVARSRGYSSPKYKLFRGVNPSWDNTARRKNNGNILANSNPCDYQEWLFNAILNTQSMHPNKDEQIIFVNAWNEWAEGAHLEPDERYGYAYLEATRIAQLRADLTRTRPNSHNHLAIAVHAFYRDVFLDLLDRITQIKDIHLKLFVSTTTSQREVIEGDLQNSGLNYEIVTVENRGRDILPFIKISKKIIAEGFGILLKLHTKKSTHRTDGDVWRNDLFDKLLSRRAIESAIELFDSDNRVGMLAPAGHLVPMSFYWGSNSEKVKKLGSRLGQNPKTVEQLHFSAGTMFFARVDALMPLLDLAIGDDDFEEEAGQVDGTLAHAIERAFAISCHAAGYQISELSTCEPCLASGEYRFAKAHTSPGVCQ